MQDKTVTIQPSGRSKPHASYIRRGIAESRHLRVGFETTWSIANGRRMRQTVHDDAILGPIGVMTRGQPSAAGPKTPVLTTTLLARVLHHDPRYGLSTLFFANGELRVPLVDAPVDS